MVGHLVSQWTSHGGFCDNQPLAEPLDTLEPLYAMAAELKPKWWRLLAIWGGGLFGLGAIAKQRDPGPAVAGINYNGFTPPQTKNRDWSTLDRCVNRILSVVGCDILLNVGQSRPGYTNSAKVAQDYAAFAVECVQRYKPGGPGIAPRNAGLGVTAIEIWNEQNVTSLWDGKALLGYGKKVDPAEYSSYVKAAYLAVKAVAPEVQVIFGGTQHVRKPVKGYWGDGFVTEQEIDFYKRCFDAIPNLGDYVDGWAVHPYTTADADFTGFAPDPTDEAFTQLQEIRDFLVSKGYGSKPIWWTEIGYPTNVVSEEQQRDYHETAMAMWGSMPWVSDYIIYSLWDRAQSKIEKEKWYGCIRRDYTPKPLYNWLKEQVGLVVDPADATADSEGIELSNLTDITPGEGTADATDLIIGDFINLGAPGDASGDSTTVDIDNTIELDITPGSGTADAVSIPLPRNYSHNFSGSTKPTLIDGGQNAASYVYFGIIREGKSPGSSGIWYSWALWPQRLGTPNAVARLVREDGTVPSNRGIGAALFSDTGNGVLAPVVGLSGGTGAQIIPVVAGVVQPAAAQNTSVQAVDDEQISIQTTVTDGIATFTILIDGVSTGVSWIDTAGLVGLPAGDGWYGGVAFQQRRSGGVDYQSPGATSMSGQDL